MATYSFTELNSIVADTVQGLINIGYRVSRNKEDWRNDVPKSFTAVLNKSDKDTNDIYTIILHESLTDNDYTFSGIAKVCGKTEYTTSTKYYKAYENIYSDNKEEAEKLRSEYNDANKKTAYKTLADYVKSNKLDVKATESPKNVDTKYSSLNDYIKDNTDKYEPKIDFTSLTNLINDLFNRNMF